MAIRRFVLAVDEAHSTFGLWREACTLAHLLQAEIVPVHVTLEDPGDLPGLAARLDAQLAAPPGVTRSKIHLYRPGLSVAGAILDAAQEQRADMIVLGAGEKSTLDRVLLGSVAEAVSRRASLPVWIVRPAVEARSLKTVLCAVDGSPAGRAALSGAVELARAAGAKLVTLAVVSKTDKGPDALLATKIELRELLQGLGQNGDDQWIEVLEGTDPSAEILEQASSTGCDVLVLGQASRTGLKRLWRSNRAEALLRALPCSLLAIHAPS
jgi:nucleotide-binding universal stress UspA family protein